MPVNFLLIHDQKVILEDARRETLRWIINERKKDRVRLANQRKGSDGMLATSSEFVRGIIGKE